MSAGLCVTCAKPLLVIRMSNGKEWPYCSLKCEYEHEAQQVRRRSRFPFDPVQGGGK